LRRIDQRLGSALSDLSVLNETTGRIDIRLKIVEAHMTGFMSSAKYLETETTPCAAASKRASTAAVPPKTQKTRSRSAGRSGFLPRLHTGLYTLHRPAPAHPQISGARPIKIRDLTMPDDQPQQVQFNPESLLSVSPSLDHPVRPRQHVARNRQADLLRRFQVDHKFELRRLLHREVSGLGTFENLVDISGGAVEQVWEASAIGHKATCVNELSDAVHRREPMLAKHSTTEPCVTVH
jgi:hypothetical protein